LARSAGLHGPAHGARGAVVSDRHQAAKDAWPVFVARIGHRGEAYRWHHQFFSTTEAIHNDHIFNRYIGSVRHRASPGSIEPDEVARGAPRGLAGRTPKGGSADRQDDFLRRKPVGSPAPRRRERCRRNNTPHTDQAGDEGEEAPTRPINDFMSMACFLAAQDGIAALRQGGQAVANFGGHGGG
jgi:hypothetical protein